MSRKRTPALQGIETRTDRRGRTRYRPKVYDRRIKRHVAGPWTTSLAEARAWRIDLQAAVRAGTRSGSANDVLRVEMPRFLERMRTGEIRNRSGRQYKPSVCRSYESCYRLYLDRHLGVVRPEDLRRRDIQAVVDRLKLSHDASTVRNALMPLRAYYRWAIARDIVSVNPTTGIELPALEGRRERFATAAEAAVLIGALPGQDRCLWAMLFYAGLRVGEARALSIRDVDLGEGVIRVRTSWDAQAGPVEPKSRAGRRTISIPHALRRYLEPHMAALTWDEGLVFGREADVPFSPQSATQRADRIWKQKGLTRITPHEARHTFASLMIDAMKRDQSLNPKVLSRIMGHSTIAETMDRYGHLMPGSEAEAAAALDAYLACGRAIN